MNLDKIQYQRIKLTTSSETYRKTGTSPLGHDAHMLACKFIQWCLVKLSLLYCAWQCAEPQWLIGRQGEDITLLGCPRNLFVFTFNFPKSIQHGQIHYHKGRMTLNHHHVKENVKIKDICSPVRQSKKNMYTKGSGGTWTKTTKKKWPPTCPRMSWNPGKCSCS